MLLLFLMKKSASSQSITTIEKVLQIIQSFCVTQASDDENLNAHKKRDLCIMDEYEYEHKSVKVLTNM